MDKQFLKKYFIKHEEKYTKKTTKKYFDSFSTACENADIFLRGIKDQKQPNDSEKVFQTTRLEEYQMVS